MERRTKVIVAAAAVATLALAGAGTAVAIGGDAILDDREAPITGADLDRASASALAHTGGGQVTDTEVGDEDSYYEVEVTLDDGSQVDVQLNEQFVVVGDAQDVEDGEGSGD